MDSMTITIAVDPATARAYASATRAERRKMRLLLSLRLSEVAMPKSRSMLGLMDDISDEAVSRGMTPEVLNQLCADA